MPELRPQSGTLKVKRQADRPFGLARRAWTCTAPRSPRLERLRRSPVAWGTVGQDTCQLDPNGAAQASPFGLRARQG